MKSAPEILTQVEALIEDVRAIDPKSPRITVAVGGLHTTRDLLRDHIADAPKPDAPKTEAPKK